MSSLRRHRPGDSLDLLLDTMCNMFGGIIIISLLMALLSRDPAAESAGIERAAAHAREIQQAREELARAQTLQAPLQERLKFSAPLVALAAQREELRKRAELDRAAAQSNNALASISVPTEPSAIETNAAQKAALTGEIKQLNDQLERAQQSRQRQLRLPRERDTGKQAFFFVARYGRIYPIHTFQNGERELNNETIHWTSDGDARTANPLRELPANTAIPNFVRLLRDIPRQTYTIHFLVYDDSFPAFLAARQLPLNAGYDTGWEFLDSSRDLTFSSGGSAPPAL
jgi:hypothetical protein